MTLMTGAKCQGGAFAADVADPNFAEIETRLSAVETSASMTRRNPIDRPWASRSLRRLQQEIENLNELLAEGQPLGKLERARTGR
jgi:hypothetical protein